MAAEDDQTPIDLTSTVTISKRSTVASALEVRLNKRVVEGFCGNVQYLTDVHVDSSGKLQPGRS